MRYQKRFARASSNFIDEALEILPIVIWNVSSFQYRIDPDRRNCQSSSQLAEDGDTSCSGKLDTGKPIEDASSCHRHSTVPGPFRLDDVWQLVSSFPRRGKSRSGLSIVPVRPGGRVIFCAYISRFDLPLFSLSFSPSLFSPSLLSLCPHYLAA